MTHVPQAHFVQISSAHFAPSSSRLTGTILVHGSAVAVPPRIPAATSDLSTNPGEQLSQDVSIVDFLPAALVSQAAFWVVGPSLCHQPGSTCANGDRGLFLLCTHQRKQTSHPKTLFLERQPYSEWECDSPRSCQPAANHSVVTCWVCGLEHGLREGVLTAFSSSLWPSFEV